MCPYIPPGITAVARRLRSRSSARTFSRLAMSDMPFRSDQVACDRLDAHRVEPIVVVEGGGRADHDVLVGHAVAPEHDAGAGLRDRLRDRGAEPAGDVVLLDGEDRAGLAGG